MKSDLGNYRKSYSKNSTFKFNDFNNPFNLFSQWFEEFDNDKNNDSEVNAMTLSTVSLNGFPKNRIVLLKEFNENGFIFYTNYNSEKGLSISKNNKVCLSFFWEEHERQIIIKGNAEKISNSKSNEYFNSRPRGSQLGAVVSDQSSVITSKKELVDRLLSLDMKYTNTSIPKPSHWGGFIVYPVEFEFWQGGKNRLHDRIRFLNDNNTWVKDRLSP
ncbi:pyridoxamine 5'-phosphate oxidase [Flavobacteriaceae bacterium]|nr:pyridoxamine 5'-phosphate oxidase [Flavobacteriaceae bacterium]MDB9712646.1 pyridoxamine 5'-phosphate oxidase [Flavobacteriaceae bacterium]MDC1491816.1 pyridoxamine 5'-phosphate oxidase [Flavobacteriaceae bacterium]